MERFWEKMHFVFLSEPLDLGYSNHIGMITFESPKSDQSVSETSDTDDPGLVRKEKRCLKPIATLIPEVSGSSVSKEASLFFLVEKLGFVDLECILKMIQYFKYFVKKDNDTLKMQLKCTQELPFLVIYDVVIYNEEILQHNHKITSIGLQMKANMYPFKKNKEVNFISPIEIKLTNLQTSIKTEVSKRGGSFSPPIFLRDFTLPEAAELKEDVSILFTDICGDISIPYKADMIYCRFPNVETTLKIIPPHNVVQLSRLSDIVFAIENYNILYIKDFIQNYVDLILDDNNREDFFNKIPSRWALSFVSYDKGLGDTLLPKDYLFIGFFYKGIQRSILQPADQPRKIPSKRISFEESKSSVPAKKKRTSRFAFF